MPPPRCNLPLRPCLHPRRAFSGPRRPLSSSQTGNGADTRPQRESQRSTGWWTSLVGRASSVFLKDVPPESGTQKEPAEPNTDQTEQQKEETRVDREVDARQSQEDRASVEKKLQELQEQVRRLQAIIDGNVESSRSPPSAKSQGAVDENTAFPRTTPQIPKTETTGDGNVELSGRTSPLPKAQATVSGKKESYITPPSLSTQPAIDSKAELGRGTYPLPVKRAVKIKITRADREKLHNTIVEAKQALKFGLELRDWNWQLQTMSSPKLAPFKRSLHRFVEDAKFAKAYYEADRDSKGISRDVRKIVQQIKDMNSPGLAPLKRYLALGNSNKRFETLEGKSHHAPVERPVSSKQAKEPARNIPKITPKDPQQLGLATSRSGERNTLEEKAQKSTEKTAFGNVDQSSSSGTSEQSLLEELFPEATSYTEPHYPNRNSYPKLGLPEIPGVPLRPTYTDKRSSRTERPIQSESLVALQLLHCSTELTEADFRRLVPKGQHIDTWVRNGEFHKVIPGRDPFTLERLPFYYLVFKSTESALQYQNNVVRLHKLSGLHQPTSIFSAIPPPQGFLEDGEDLNKVLSTYFLKPPTLNVNLNMVMQPYNPKLRALIHDGGYKPIVPSVNAKCEPLWKVLLHIEGWEPSRDDLYFAFFRHAYDSGLTWPFHNDKRAFHRLRDVINIKSGTDLMEEFNAVSAANPRAASSFHEETDIEGEEQLNLDPLEQSGSAKGGLSQIIMTKLYNRWIVEFEEENAARRFARMWHRRVLPNQARLTTWKDTEEVRMVNAEFLW